MFTQEQIKVITTQPLDWPKAEADWIELANLSPYASFFLQAEWIGTWIETYRPFTDIEILRFFCERKIVGACLLVWRKQRLGPISIRRAYLNASGEDEWEEVGTEFNDLLCLQGWETAVANALRRHLDCRNWDEFMVNGCSRTAASASLQQAFEGYEQNATTSPSYYVDLTALRTNCERFEMSLTYKVRYKIRQSITQYKQSGRLCLRRARSIDDAKAMLAELAKLHQARWNTKGQPGAFASPRFQQFHRVILEKCFTRGEIDILRVSVENETVGILYNYVQKNKAFFYQCGFKFSDNNKLRPGLVTLQLALQFYLESTLPEFDLMAGDVEYKRSLAKQYRALDWHTFRRSSWRNSLIDHLRNCKRRLKLLRR